MCSISLSAFLAVVFSLYSLKNLSWINSLLSANDHFFLGCFSFTKPGGTSDDQQAGWYTQQKHWRSNSKEAKVSQHKFVFSIFSVWGGQTDQ